MNFKPAIVILSFMLWAANTCAQDTNYFRAKLGKPSELFRLKSGIEVTIDYNDKEQVCSISIGNRSGHNNPYSSLQAIAEELVPLANRGALVKSSDTIGNCIDIKNEEYERVIVSSNMNSCYTDARGIHVTFKRDSCPKPLSIP